MNNIKSNKTFKKIIAIILTVVGAFLLALSMHVFTIPAKFAPGGVSGIASIIQIITGFPAGYSMLIFNIPLIILSFIYLSKKFSWLSLLGIALASGFLQLFDYVNLYEFVNANETIISALAGGIMSGVGVGLMVRSEASSGGTEIISLLIQRKFTSVSIAWIVLSINIFIITIGGILYYFLLKMSPTDVITIMIFSFMQVFISAKTMEVILNGLSSAVKFEVITQKPQELSQAIIEKLRRGVTIIDSYGCYSKGKNSYLICVVTRMQISPFKRLLKSVDPSAFAVSINTREVLGTGFRCKR